MRATASIVLATMVLALGLASSASAQTLPCTYCHRPGGAPLPHNSGCTDTPCLESCHPSITFDRISHLTGPATPFTGERTSTCNTCHNRPWSGVYHPYRVNVLPGTQTPPGIVDLDDACGQCHGGGVGQLPCPSHSTSGSIAAGSTTLIVADGTGFVVAQRIGVAGAGIAGAQLTSHIASVAGTTIVLDDAAATSVTNAVVVMNPTSPGVPYYSKDALATVAATMHELSAVTYPVTFSILVPANTLDVTVDGVVSCSLGCPPLTYDWDWNDATNHGTTDPATHTYATAGVKTIDLVVRSAGLIVGGATRSVVIPNPDLPPEAASSYGADVNAWTVTVQDASVDDGPDGDMLPGDGDPLLRIVYDWGDGSLKTTVARGGSATHAYLSAGSPTVTQIVTDSALKQVSRTCGSATFAPFTISGTVLRRDGVTPIGSAMVQVRKGSLFVKTLYTAASGAFTADQLKPGTYTLVVTKYGYQFANPAATITVGPTSSGNVILATAP